MREFNFQNRDSDTHMHYIHDLGYTREDLRDEDLAEWEKEYVHSVFEYDDSDNLREQ